MSDVDIVVKIESDDVEAALPFENDSDDASSDQVDEEEEAPDYSTRGHDWIADKYFELLESGDRPDTPSSVRTATEAGENEDVPAAVQQSTILRHVVHRLLRNIVCTGECVSSGYDPAQATSVWKCPLRGCGHCVDPLQLDSDSRAALYPVFGALGMCLDRWSARTVLAREIDMDNDDNTRLRMTPEEIRHRRTGMELIAWSHIQKFHIGVYGVRVRDLGIADEATGVRGVGFEPMHMPESLFAYGPGVVVTTDEEHRVQLARIRADEIRRMEAERHNMRVLLTRWHHRQNRFIDHAVEYCRRLPYIGRAPGKTSGRIIMAGLERLREECEPDFARARLRVVEDAL